MNLSTRELSEIKRLLVDFFKRQEVVSDRKERQVVWTSIDRATAQVPGNKLLRVLIPSFAAAAAVAVGVFLFFAKEEQPRLEDFSTTAAELLANNEKSEEIRLILSSDEEFKVERGATVEYSQNEITIDDNLVSKAEEISSVQLDKIIVPNGTYTSLILSDGSKMYINSGTTVVFPRQFKSGKREIFVDGEIFIDVAKNDKAPFVVTTYNFNVEVTGTVFNVNAYSNYPGNQEVVLAEGSVDIRSKSGKLLTLSPNMKAVISGGGDISRTTVNARDYTYWTQGILFLHIAKTKDILLKLSRYYGTTITCSPDIADVEIVGKVDLDGGVWEALNRVADAGRFNLFRNETGYELVSRK